MLTSKLMYHGMPRKGTLIRPTNPFDAFEAPERDYLKLLLLLDRDAKNERLCSRCRKFHPEISKQLRTDPQTMVWRDRSESLQNLCGEGFIAIGEYGIDWSVIQSVMRSICHGDKDKDQQLLLTIGERWKDEESGWEYHVRGREAFGRLLLRVEGKVIIKGHYPPYAHRPRKVSEEMLYGFPDCLCMDNPGYQLPLWQNVKCMLSHSHIAPTKLQRLLPTRPANVQLCSKCCFSRCKICGSEYKGELKRWDDTASDAYLTVTRIIDCGPVDWAVRPKLFNKGPLHPVYRVGHCIGMDERRKLFDMIPRHPFFDPEAHLWEQWYYPMRLKDQLKRLRNRLGKWVGK